MGVYHARHILITTPSYTFNQRFYPPQENPDDPPPASRGGYPDPTGRTNRVFRHSDHKFEWTPEEFAQWCNESAEEWGYEVRTLTAIGRASEDDPWGRDNELGGASQVAHLVRLDDDNSFERRRKKAKEIKRGIMEGPEHQLLKRHYHRTHPSAHKPQPREEIAQAVYDRMMEDRQMLMVMEELWMQQEISTKCGGYFERLIDAVATDERFQLMQDERRSRREWSVRLTGDVLMEPALEVEGEWEPESVGQHSYEFDSLTEEDEPEEGEEDTEGETPEPNMGPEDAEHWYSEDYGWGSHEAYWRKANTEAWGAIDSSGWDNTHIEEESVDHGVERKEEGINA
jgi:small RNA 2'-O-methyltransferase